MRLQIVLTMKVSLHILNTDVYDFSIFNSYYSTRLCLYSFYQNSVSFLKYWRQTKHQRYFSYPNTDWESAEDEAWVWYTFYQFCIYSFQPRSIFLFFIFRKVSSSSSNVIRSPIYTVHHCFLSVVIYYHLPCILRILKMFSPFSIVYIL